MRPLLGNSLISAEPKAVDSAELMASNGTPRASALLRSMRRSSAGASDRPSTIMYEKICGFSNTFLIRVSVADSRASRPRPERSCRRSAKPEELPMPSTEGGTTENSVPSGTSARFWLAWSASAMADSFLSRLAQSLNITKPRPAFWPWPEKLKPCTVSTSETAGRVPRYCSRCWVVSSVRDSVAPGGSCTSVFM